MDSDFKPPKNTRPRPAQLKSNGLNNEPAESSQKPVFKTPEQIATEPDSTHPANPEAANPEAANPETANVETGAEDASLEPKILKDNEIMSKKPKSKWNAFNRLNWPPGKKEWITFAVIVLLLISGSVAYALTHKQPETLKPIPKVTDASKTVPSTLTGLPVAPSVNKRTVTGVMIENSVPARPQAGLSQAGVVFEAIAEAGITRFLALYQDTAPNNVGPVRSARPYFVRWNMAFDAGYAHVGGSPEALTDINNWNVRDLNQFYDAGAYHRIGSREAPHNVYTGIPALNKLEVAKGYTTSKYSGFTRKSKAWRPRSQPITARHVNFAISQAAYNVSYAYDDKTDSYARSEGGTPHIDANNNKQIRPVVVIAMVIPYAIEADGYHSTYSNLGSGEAYIFQDGRVIRSTWAKKSNQAQITFKDARGKNIALNPGQTWITAVAAPNQITYTAK